MTSISKQLRARLAGLCEELASKQASVDLVPILSGAIKDLTISLAIATEKGL